MFRAKDVIANLAMAVAALTAAAMFWHRSKLVVEFVGVGNQNQSIPLDAGLLSPHNTAKSHDSNCRVEGVVLGESDNEAIPGAILILVPVGDSDSNVLFPLPTISALAVTNLDGQWAATLPRSKSVIVSANAPSYLPQLSRPINPCNWPEAEATKFRLKHGGVSVRGTVAGPSANAAYEALVLAKATHRDALGHEIQGILGAVSGLDGRYWLQVELGQYDFQAFQTGGLTSRRVTKELGHQPNRVDFEIMPTASITGRVIVQGRDSRLQGIAVNMRDETGVRYGSDLLHPTAFVTNDSGEFEIDLVRPGTVELSARGQGFASLNSIPIDLAPGEKLVGVELPLERGHSISGELFRADANLSQPSDIWAYASDARSGVAVASCRVNRRTGHFEIGGLRPSTYKLELSVDHSMLRHLIGPITLTDTDIHIPPIQLETGAKLSGRISPRSAGTVQLSRVPSERSVTTNVLTATGTQRITSVADARGTFSFDGVDGGDVVLTADSQDGLHGETQVHVGRQDLSEVMISVKRRASLSGSVIEVASGQPAREAWVSVCSNDAAIGCSSQLVRTKADGSFEFRNLDDGNYSLSTYGSEGKLVQIQSSGTSTAFEDLVTLARSEAKSGLVLQVDPCRAAISGIVVGEDQVPVPNVWIAAQAQISKVTHSGLRSGPVEHHAVSEQSGRFLLSNLCQGFYGIRAVDMSGRQASFAYNVSSNASVKLTLEKMGWLEGLVEFRGKPVNEFSVVVSGPDQKVLDVRSSDARFRTQLPAGDYEILVEAERGYFLASLVLASNRTQSISVNLIPWSSVRGRIAFRNNAPAAGIGVTLTLLQLTGKWHDAIGPNSSLRPIHAVTSTDGSFKFDRVPGRTGRVSFRTPTGAMLRSSAKTAMMKGERQGLDWWLEVQSSSDENRDLGTIVVGK